MDLKKPQCDGDCGRPAESTGRGYRMVGGYNFWCGHPNCIPKIQAKIQAGYDAYDKARREQLGIKRFNESGKEI